MSWITHGKTIENYVPDPVLKRAMHEVYGDRKYDIVLDDPYVGPLDKTFPGVESKPDIIKIAHIIVRWGHEFRADLSG